MPVFDRDPLPTASEREEARRARLEQQRKKEAHKKEVKDFYAAIKRGSITPFARDSKESKEPGIPVHLSFSRDQKNIASYKTSFKSQVSRAKIAVQKHDPLRLKAILGPELFLSRQQFLAQSVRIQQDWLANKCRLEFLKELGLFITHHITANDLPDVLSADQHQHFINELKIWIRQKDTMDRLTAHAKDWNVSNPSHVASVLSIFEHIIDVETSPLYKEKPGIKGINQVLYDLNKTKEKLQKKCEKCQLQQQELNKNFVEQNSAEHVNQKWLDFQREVEKGLTGTALTEIREEIQNSRENPFAELGLANEFFYGNNKQESVFDYVAELYEKAISDRDKKNLLSCIEILLIHGDKPSAALNPEQEEDQNKIIAMDWALLSLVLTHLNPETNFSRNVRNELLSYCEKSQKALDSWFGQIFLNPVIKESRRKDVQYLVVLLCTVNASKIDQVLAEKIKQKSILILETRHQNSILYSGMKQLMQKTENGELVLAIAAGKDLPMQPMSSAQTLTAPGRNSVFYQSSSSIADLEKDVEVEKAETKGKGLAFSADEVD